MSLIDAIIGSIIAVEGRIFTNDPNDPGGPTKFGITLKALSSYRGHPCTADDVRNLQESEARDIYYQFYVTKPKFGPVLALAPKLGAECVDSGVNCGTERACMWLQTALNAFNRSNITPPDYPELKVDGDLGPKTIGALGTFIRLRGATLAETVLLRAMNSQQGAYYLSLGLKDPKFESFMFGWFSQRVS